MKKQKQPTMMSDWGSRVYSIEVILLTDFDEDPQKIEKIEKIQGLAPVLTKIPEMTLSELIEILASYHGLKLSKETISEVARVLRLNIEDMEE